MNTVKLKTMCLKVMTVPFALALSSPSFAGGNANSFITYTKFDRVEWASDDSGAFTDNAVLAIEAEGWAGHDLKCLWWQADVELDGTELESARWEVGYQQAMSPYWNARVGARRDQGQQSHRSWVAAGVEGLAPFFLESQVMVYADDESHLQLEVSIEKEWMITQRLVLIPEADLTWLNRTDRSANLGEGLSEISLGIRLAYEWIPKISPYLSIDWSRKFGETADFAEQNHEPAGQTHYALGVQWWF